MMTNYLLLIDTDYANWLNHKKVVEELEHLKAREILRGKISSAEVMRLSDLDGLFPEEIRTGLAEVFKGYAVITCAELASRFEQRFARELCGKYNLEFRICRAEDLKERVGI
jgi:hypothetical protein